MRSSIFLLQILHHQARVAVSQAKHRYFHEVVGMIESKNMPEEKEKAIKAAVDEYKRAQHEGEDGMEWSWDY